VEENIFRKKHPGKCNEVAHGYKYACATLKWDQEKPNV
jgi:hypothetical protein